MDFSAGAKKFGNFLGLISRSRRSALRCCGVLVEWVRARAKSKAKTPTTNAGWSMNYTSDYRRDCHSCKKKKKKMKKKMKKTNKFPSDACQKETWIHDWPVWTWEFLQYIFRREYRYLILLMRAAILKKWSSRVSETHAAFLMRGKIRWDIPKCQLRGISDRVYVME